MKFFKFIASLFIFIFFLTYMSPSLLFSVNAATCNGGGLGFTGRGSVCYKKPFSSLWAGCKAVDNLQAEWFNCSWRSDGCTRPEAQVSWECHYSNPFSCSTTSPGPYVGSTTQGCSVSGGGGGYSQGAYGKSYSQSYYYAYGQGYYQATYYSQSAYPPPTATLYPTAAIQGNLREFDGPSCHNDISTNGLAVSLQATNSQSITTDCGVTPPTGTTKTSYRCTIAFDNQAATKPTPAQDFTVAATTTEYQPGYLVDSAVCTATGSGSFAVDVANPTPVNNVTKDLLFELTKPWIKIKNGSFASANNLSNPIPLTIGAYKPGDADDDVSQRVFIMNSGGSDPGTVTASSLNIGTANASSKGWRADYQKIAVLNPTTFFEYVKARKEFVSITQADLSEIETNKIHVWTGDLTIDSGKVAEFNDKNAVLIATGTINITADFKPTNASVAIIANAITFAGDPSPVTEADGLFVANTINAGTTAAQGLKINGNMIAANPFTNTREWGSNSRPSIFINFNPQLFMNLLPYISTSKYEYQQTQ